MWLQHLRKIDKCLRTFPNYLCRWCNSENIFAVVDFSHVFPLSRVDFFSLSPLLRWLKLMASLPFFEDYFCFSPNCFQILLNGNGWLSHFSIWSSLSLSEVNLTGVLLNALIHKKLQNSKICPKALLRTIPFTICFCWRKKLFTDDNIFLLFSVSRWDS